jgi:5-methylcytosine-specific restriction endonuclease McrA
MKRSPLKRNKGLKPISDKRAKLLRETSADRKRYRDGVWLCECCSKRQSVEVHEIVRRSTNAESIRHPCAWMALCRPCHEEMGDYSQWPITRQLACKLLATPEQFDLAMINELRGRSEQAIEWSEVTKWLRLS